MMAACQEMPGLCGLVVKVAISGLQSEEARVQRRLSDGRWAARFRAEPLREVFNDWYQQPVFSSLNAAQREALVDLRSQNNGLRWRRCWRPPRLPYNLIYVRNSLRAHFRFYYLCGERDDKFRALATEMSVNHVIRNAGHNAHRDNPLAWWTVWLRFYVADYRSLYDLS